MATTKPYCTAASTTAATSPTTATRPTTQPGQQQQEQDRQQHQPGREWAGEGCGQFRRSYRWRGVCPLETDREASHDSGWPEERNTCFFKIMWWYFFRRRGSYGPSNGCTGQDTSRENDQHERQAESIQKNKILRSRCTEVRIPERAHFLKLRNQPWPGPPFPVL